MQDSNLSHPDPQTGADPIGRQAILAFALSNNLGIIPDSAGDWLTQQAIAKVLGYEVEYVQNRFGAARKIGREPKAHPLGRYYRLADAVECMSDAKESPPPKKTKRRR